MADPVASPLSIDHITLDTLAPYRVWVLPASREHLVYALVGRMRVYANDQWLGTIGGRRSVTDPLAHVIRFPAGAEVALTLILEGSGADCLLVGADAIENRVSKLPYWHWCDTPFHDVGEGTHRRRVGEVPTPPGFVLSCGETWQEAGMVSSWPPHATQADLELFAESKTTWEESFFFICPSPATVTMMGLFSGNSPIYEVRPAKNGSIMAMCLGSHQVQAPPSSWAYYAWFYCGSALKKQYNVNSLDVGTYRQ